METNERKALPIGVDSFYDMRSSNFCYVDKTFFIQRLLDTEARAMLFTRPRRFGKSIALSMLRSFFDCHDKERNRRLFDGLAISRSERHMAEQGKYPVIFLCLKDVKGSTQADVEDGFRNAMLDTLEPFEYLLHSDKLSDLKKERLRKVMSARASIGDLSHSLRLLCSALYDYHGQPSVILVDEYDTPLQAAYLNGFYQPVCDIMRNFFSSAFKGNDNLRLGVITGVMRIAKDSLFSGLNNLRVDTVLSDNFADCFGFTQAEVEDMAANYAASDKIDEIRAWYDGYRFGEQDIYNPWSVLQYFGNDCKAQAYWLDTSSNDLTIEFLRHLEKEQRQDVETLYVGGTVEATLDTSVVYRKLDKCDAKLIFSLLTMTGYLKPVGELGRNRYLLQVPNAEITTIFADEILDYLEANHQVTALHRLWDALRCNDEQAFAAKLKDVLIQSSSYLSNQEAYYQGFMMCLLLGLDEQYRVLSEREAGLGRADILLRPRSDKKLPGFVFEIKRGDAGADLDQLAETALRQIAEKRYAEEFPPDIREVRCYGLAFCKKDCSVKMASVMR